jgi:hypothetical protein
MFVNNFRLRNTKSIKADILLACITQHIGLIIDFYSSMFENLDLSPIPEFPSSNSGRKGSYHALFRSVIVMRSEKFGEISDI